MNLVYVFTMMESRTQRRTSQVWEAPRKTLLHMLAIYAFQLITGLELTTEPQHKVPKPAKGIRISLFHCAKYLELEDFLHLFPVI